MLTTAGLAGRVALVTGCGPLVFVVPWRTCLQALHPLSQVDKAFPAIQTVSATRTPTLVAGRVTSLTNHGGHVSKVTEKKREYPINGLAVKHLKVSLICVPLPLWTGFNAAAAHFEKSRFAGHTLQTVTPHTRLTADVAALTPTANLILDIVTQRTLFQTGAVWCTRIQSQDI